ncbi:MAG: hypothetical protein QM619_14780 [Micropruina sp.]|uniref:deoxyribose-phosphate aldolase n=1 Tax=Micropruina sp. TaxID=2737536 RepID=UPI0039E683D6
MLPDKPAAAMSATELAAYIDHSVLKPEFSAEEIAREVANGVRYGCRTVCVNPAAIEIAAPLCKGTDTGLCVVVAFPFGLSMTASRIGQARNVLAAGVEAAVAADADFVKTSTGFYTGTTQHEQTGASDGIVRVMMDAAAGRCQVKGSGGIRDRAHFLRLIDAGIDRVGIGYRATPVVLGLGEGPATVATTGY